MYKGQDNCAKQQQESFASFCSLRARDLIRYMENVLHNLPESSSSGSTRTLSSRASTLSESATPTEATTSKRSTPSSTPRDGTVKQIASSLPNSQHSHSVSDFVLARSQTEEEFRFVPKKGKAQEGNRSVKNRVSFESDLNMLSPVEPPLDIAFSARTTPADSPRSLSESRCRSESAQSNSQSARAAQISKGKHHFVSSSASRVTKGTENEHWKTMDHRLYSGLNAVKRSSKSDPVISAAEPRARIHSEGLTSPELPRFESPRSVRETVSFGEISFSNQSNQHLVHDNSLSESYSSYSAGKSGPNHKFMHGVRSTLTAREAKSSQDVSSEFYSLPIELRDAFAGSHTSVDGDRLQQYTSSTGIVPRYGLSATQKRPTADSLQKNQAPDTHNRPGDMRTVHPLHSDQRFNVTSDTSPSDTDSLVSFVSDSSISSFRHALKAKVDMHADVGRLLRCGTRTGQAEKTANSGGVVHTRYTQMPSPDPLRFTNPKHAQQ